MIHGRRKTIGVFVNATDMYFTGALYQSLRRKAAEMRLDLFFFVSIGYGTSPEDYAFQERETIRFAPVEDLDGIIFVPDSYDVTRNRDYVREELHRRASCPIVSLRSPEDFDASVFMEETISLRPLVRHLIEDHGLTRLAYITGYREHLPTLQREECFRQEMAAHGLNIPEGYILQGNMWYSTGLPAYQHFFEKLEQPPQAIVCANDFMAKGLIDELIRHGKRVPEDVVITGFDNSIEAGGSPVSLTTIEQDYGTMAELALLQLQRRITQDHASEPERIGIPGRLILGESCGCARQDPNRLYTILQAKEARMNEMNVRENDMAYLAMELAGCDSLAQLRQILLWRKENIPDQRDYYICLFDQQNSAGQESIYAEQITDRARLAIALQAEDNPLPEESFDRRLILPLPEGEKPRAWMISLLYLRDQIYGYSILQYQEGYEPGVYFQHRDVIISGALRNIRNYQEMQRLYEERRISSITDPLTGLYNRRGLEENIMPRWETLCRERSHIAFIYFDMDYLKRINDQYGHEAGDAAICMIAKAMREAVPAGAVYARMGGDEFLAVLPGLRQEATRQMMLRFAEVMEESNLSGGHPFQVQYSCGSFEVRLQEGMTLYQCIRRSDKMMYEIKKRRHGS